MSILRSRSRGRFLLDNNIVFNVSMGGRDLEYCMNDNSLIHAIKFYSINLWQVLAWKIRAPALFIQASLAKLMASEL